MFGAVYALASYIGPSEHVGFLAHADANTPRPSRTDIFRFHSILTNNVHPTYPSRLNLKRLTPSSEKAHKKQNCTCTRDCIPLPPPPLLPSLSYPERY